jgi:hypothetical protein
MSVKLGHRKGWPNGNAVDLYLGGAWLDSWGHAVAYLVEAVCYKPEGQGFKSR